MHFFLIVQEPFLLQAMILQSAGKEKTSSGYVIQLFESEVFMGRAFGAVKCR